VFDGVFISSDGISLGDQNEFQVTNAGALTATSGQIAGFSILSSNLQAGAGSTYLNISTDKIYMGSEAHASAPFKVTNAGVLTSTSGTIGGWTIGSTLSATNILLDPSTPKITLGGKGTLTDSNAGAYIGTDGIGLGANSPFKVTNAGVLTSTSGTIGGWTIGSTLSATNILLDPSTPKITLGGKGTLTDSNAGAYIGTDGIGLGANSPFKVTNAGVLTSTSGTIGGWTIGSTLSATNILLDPSTPKITLGGKGTLTDSNAGAYIGTDGIGLGANSPFKVTNAGVLTSTSGTIGGWTIGTSTIVGSNLTLNNAGIIETNDFTSGVKGFRLDSAGNGSAEFNDVSIRGTLSTTVFEKESVNAVGGQLYVANSTVLTSSLYGNEYQSNWSGGVNGWTSGHTQAGNQDSVSDGTTTKSDVYRIVVAAGVGLHSLRDVSLTVGKQYTVSLTYLIPDAGSTGGANGGVDGFRFAIDDSSDKGIGTYDSAVNVCDTVVQVPTTPESYVPIPLSLLSSIANLNPSTPPFAPPVEPASGIK
jgi:hypothetical protein